MSTLAVVANGFTHAIGQLFHPIFVAFASVLALFYAIIPNYAIAIILLTLVVMAVTAPLTVKSTKSMAAMQRLAPEMKKLQAKYKGDRVTLNEEMMKLYREHGANPAGGCLPLLIQFPFFIALYDVIRGLTHTSRVPVTTQILVNGVPKTVTTFKTVATPLYIGKQTSLYQSLVGHPGQMRAFGINLADNPFTHGISGVERLILLTLVAIAIGLQYFQMHQMNKRNPAAQANSQMQTMQRVMPLLFAVIYIRIAAGVNIYFVVSSLCRIGIQTGIYRSGVLDRPVKDSRQPGKRRTLMERLADAQQRALDQQRQLQGARGTEESALPAPRQDTGAAKGPGRPPAAANKAPGARAAGRSPGSGASGAPRAAGPGEEKSHPRSKSKKARKAR